MKAISILIIAFLWLVSVQVYAGSASGKVSTINLYGGEWSNGWAGGMLYKLDTMPSGVSYFTVKPDDIAFKHFLSMLLAAKHTSSIITITYQHEQIDSNGYAGTLAISER